MEANTLAKAHRTPGPVQRSVIGPTLVLRGKRESQVKLETVLVSEDDNWGRVWNVRTSAGRDTYRSDRGPIPDMGIDGGFPVAC